MPTSASLQHADIADPASGKAPPQPGGLHAVKFPDPIQGNIPIKPDAKRGSDRIRARLYRDPRLDAYHLVVAFVISEHASGAALAANLKIKTINRFAHMSDRQCRRVISSLVDLGVIAVERRRTYRRFVFLDRWLRWFAGAPQPDQQTDHTGPACRSQPDQRADHRGTVRTEPVQREHARKARAGSLSLYADMLEEHGALTPENRDAFMAEAAKRDQTFIARKIAHLRNGGSFSSEWKPGGGGGR